MFLRGKKERGHDDRQDEKERDSASAFLLKEKKLVGLGSFTALKREEKKGSPSSALDARVHVWPALFFAILFSLLVSPLFLCAVKAHHNFARALSLSLSFHIGRMGLSFFFGKRTKQRRAK
nr:hypothetical protein [Pandoravirus aubagnensis]